MRFWNKWRGHVRKDLLAFCEGGLPPPELARVSEHLERCERCRREYDDRRFLSAALAAHLACPSVPEGLWPAIERRWSTRGVAAASAADQAAPPRMSLPKLATAGAVLVLGIAALVRFGLLRRTMRPAPGPASTSAPQSGPLRVDLASYVEPLKAASNEQSFRVISTAYPSSVAIDRQEALRAAGLSAVEDTSPLPGYNLRAYRACTLGGSEVVQLVYAKGRDAFSVFVAPRQLDFSYGREACVDAKVWGIHCRKVDCPFQASYVFGAGNFHCALVSKSLTERQVAAIMRYFISAHQRSEG